VRRASSIAEGFVTLIEDFGAIGDSAGGYAALGAVALEVLDRINERRSCALLFNNETDFVLTLDSHHHDHGGFEVVPDFEIPARAASLFGSQSKSGSLFTGTEGRVVYSVGDTNTFARAAWDNPFIGGNECGTRLEGERAAAFEMRHVCGSGNQRADMRYELRQVLDLRFVRSPDYRWVRLEGYMFAAAGGDPDRPPDFPAPSVGLWSYWSRTRGDNWATSNPAFARLTRLEPNYERYRFEGNLFSPSHEPPAGTVALHSWWSASREDNWTTANPPFTRPLSDRLQPDYGHYRLEGFLYSPDAPQPSNTVPVHSWWSPSRQDNFITTDPAWVP
jgi:hypothetical protein